MRLSISRRRPPSDSRGGTFARLALVAVALATVLAVAAGTSVGSPSSKKGLRASNILTIALPGDVETLDSAFAHEQISNEVRYNTSDRFFRYAEVPGPGGIPVYNVKKILGESIQSWKLSKDGKRLTLNVRRGAKFCHTGNPVTADDFVYWFQRTFGAKGSSLFNVQSVFIPGPNAVTKTGPYQFQIRFSQPSPLFFFIYRDQANAPVDSKAMKAHATSSDKWTTKWAAKNDAGSGPYCVDRILSGVEADLSTNPGYWGTKPYFDKVLLKIVPSSTDRVLLLQRGSIDVAEAVDVKAGETELRIRRGWEKLLRFLEFFRRLVECHGIAASGSGDSGKMAFAESELAAHGFVAWIEWERQRKVSASFFPIFFVDDLRLIVAVGGDHGVGRGNQLLLDRALRAFED